MKTLKNEITYDVARTPEERHRYFEIRAQAYAEDGRLPRGAGAESPLDSGSTTVVARKSGQIIGGARLLSNWDVGELPFAKIFPDFPRHLPESISLEHPCGEYGAVAVLPDHRDRSVSVGLNAYCAELGQIMGLRHVFYWTERVRARLNRIAFNAVYGALPDPQVICSEVGDFTAGDPEWQALGLLTLSVVTLRSVSNTEEMEEAA